MYSRSARVFWSVIYATCLVRCVKSATLNYGDICTTPDGKSGTCIKASECDQITKVHKNPHATNEERSYLLSLKCGLFKNKFLPLFCCETATPLACITPEGAPGNCIKAVDCPYMLSIRHKKNISLHEEMYLQNLRCGTVKGKFIPLFCCPKHQNSPDCGATMLSTRLMGGVEVEPSNHPWLALLIYKDAHNKLHLSCGGSLITERHVLTAAHCLRQKPSWTLLWVRFNEWNPTSADNCTELNDGETICRQDYGVASWVTHPEYINNGSFPHDIAVIRLATDVEFSAHLRTVCLPVTPEIRALPVIGRMFRVSGWGRNEYGEKLSSQLREVELPGLPNANCSFAYSRANVTLTEKQLCIGGQEGQDSCRGDSGGPLLGDVGITVYQVGVVSFGSHMCGSKGYPGVYTDVASYLPWIESIIFDGLLL